MPDGTLPLTLDDYAAQKFAAKAEAMGISQEELATLLLDQQLFDYDDFTRLNGDPRDPMPPLSAEDLEGGEDWAVLRPKFEAYLKAKLKDQA
jgi:hypothetical protein